MTPQSNFMIMASISHEQETALRELLATMNQAPGLADPRNAIVPFFQFANLHVARFVIIEAQTNDDIRAYDIEPETWPLTLAFIGDIDGDRDLFLAELVVRASAGLKHIFSHCDGFDSDRTDLLQWMKQHNQRATANYINWRGRTVLQIKEELALCQCLREQLVKISEDDAINEPHVIRRLLLEFVNQEISAQRLNLSKSKPTPPGWFIANLLHLVTVPAVLLILSPLFILFLPFYAFTLRRLEKSDTENILRPDRNHLQQLGTQEDLDVTNQFNVFGQVKPGRFRSYTIRFLLYMLDYAARHVYKRGFLTRIQSIHFARWVLLDDNKRVYFASNYDGSADSYMDDFINKVAWGLNLVFSNGVGYPRTRWLIKRGAEYEEKYKRTLRRNQLPSECWYKAYLGLTAVDMARNSRIRQGLQAQYLDEKEIREWLHLL